MAATWLTELLLDTLNRALLQQGGADEPASSSPDRGGAQERGDGRPAYQQVRQRGHAQAGCAAPPQLQSYAVHSGCPRPVHAWQ